MKTVRLRVMLFLAILITLMLIGTIGFTALERLSPMDALYFTIVTLSTVGYGDIYAASVAGKFLSIFLILSGVGIFLGFIAEGTHLLLQRSEEKVRKRRVNVLISLFFSEMGTELLRTLRSNDSAISESPLQAGIKDDWSEKDYGYLLANLEQHNYIVDPQKTDWNGMRIFLKDKGQLLTQLLENPNLQEHEEFTDLLLALFHLKDELLARQTFENSPETDIDHLSNDTKRVYTFLSRQWLEHLHYLKSSYPYLHSLAIRTNPFVEGSSAVVR